MRSTARTSWSVMARASDAAAGAAAAGRARGNGPRTKPAAAAADAAICHWYGRWQPREPPQGALSLPCREAACRTLACSPPAAADRWAPAEPSCLPAAASWSSASEPNCSSQEAQDR